MDFVTDIVDDHEPNVGVRFDGVSVPNDGEIVARVLLGDRVAEPVGLHEEDLEEERDTVTLWVRELDGEFVAV